MAKQKYAAISIQYLRDTFDYDYRTGELTRFGTKRSRTPDKTCGPVPSGNGRLYVNICGLPVLQHRVAWAIMHGAWPSYRIGHLNGCPSDNRLINLCAEGDPMGFRGPAFYRRRWRVFIPHGDTYRCLGPFDSASYAHAVYRDYLANNLVFCPCPGKPPRRPHKAQHPS